MKRNEEKKTFSESDTKNKRGRPRKYALAINQIVFSDMERRTAQNLYYVGYAWKEIMDCERDEFFITSKGNFRRNGILEQIGRMYDAGLINKEQGCQLINMSKKYYEEGDSIKDITNTLSKLRQYLKNPTNTITEKGGINEQ